MSNTPLSSTERIKQSSDGLRGSLTQSLDTPWTGALSEDDSALVRFHGMYQQDDRDRRDERAEKMLERHYSFMIRLRLPGGYLTAPQWVATHHIAGAHTTGVIKITSRQTIQLHGVLKHHIKPTLQAFSDADLVSVATCGDINRNVICSAHPAQSPLHAQVHAFAGRISNHLLPKSRAYYEIFLDQERISPEAEQDPLYQDRYMPRKFKIAIAIPPNNDTDVFANDIGLIAVTEGGRLKGYNIAIGGGLSTTHGNPAHYPRLATVIGFCSGEEETLKVIYEILTVQRDWGNRSDRKLARLKYTVDRVGVAAFREEVERRSGVTLEPEQPYLFSERTDYYGWRKDPSGRWGYTLFVENGRVLDTDDLPMKSTLLHIAERGLCAFRFTCHQNIILADVSEGDKEEVDRILQASGLKAHTERATPVRLQSMACVALNTCSLALAEGQRYLPHLISRIEPLLAVHGLEGEDLLIRMTGCPNGCARPYAAEIGFVGTAYGQYNLHLGGDRQGLRLAPIYRKALNEAEILQCLDGAFLRFRNERLGGEGFGDFAHRVLCEKGEAAYG